MSIFHISSQFLRQSETRQNSIGNFDYIWSGDDLKVVPYSITSIEHRADPGFLAVNTQVTLVKPGSRLPLLSTRPAVTFPAKEITPLAVNYIIILLGIIWSSSTCIISLIWYLPM